MDTVITTVGGARVTMTGAAVLAPAAYGRIAFPHPLAARHQDSRHGDDHERDDDDRRNDHRRDRDGDDPQGDQEGVEPHAELHDVQTPGDVVLQDVLPALPAQALAGARPGLGVASALAPEHPTKHVPDGRVVAVAPRLVAADGQQHRR